MKQIGFSILFLLLVGVNPINAQETTSADSLKSIETDVVPVYSKAYMKKYNQLKRIFIKVYPYALYAADVLDELEEDAASIKKRRKKNKFYKNAYKDLKEDFKYVFLDMYQSEGRWLMKLVHRETGMTVFEIAEKYRGKNKADVFTLMGKLWGQDLKAEFDANGADKIADHVIRDMENGLIDFDKEIEITSKEEYKEGMKEYRSNKKKYRKQRRKNKRDKRKQDKKD